MSVESLSSRPRPLARFLRVTGPGLIVMLADTDVGSIITAGQSGVQWGYRLLLLQILLVPILFVVQELTVRLGIFTGRGHGELIRDTFGAGWAYVSAAGLVVAVAGALLSEFSGVAGVGELYGVSRFVSLPLAAALLLAVGMTGGYRRVERIAILFGLFELAFFAVAYTAHPTVADIVSGSINIPVTDTKYLFLVAANIGAVIMPWMIFYQQSAVADKRLQPAALGAARLDTAIGRRHHAARHGRRADRRRRVRHLGRPRPLARQYRRARDRAHAIVRQPARQAAVRRRRARRGDGGGDRRLARARLGARRGWRAIAAVSKCAPPKHRGSMASMACA